MEIFINQLGYLLNGPKYVAVFYSRCQKDDPRFVGRWAEQQRSVRNKTG